MNQTDPKVLLQDPLFNMIVMLALASQTAYPGDRDKQVFRLARKFQKGSECKITRNVMERICQYRKNAAQASMETYKLLRSGDY